MWSSEVLCVRFLLLYNVQLLVKIQGAIVDTPVFQVIIQGTIESIKQKCSPVE